MLSKRIQEALNAQLTACGLNPAAFDGRDHPEPT